MAYEPHLEHLITHDLLRVVPQEEHLRGWLYAYMRTATFRGISTGAHYGHVVKHLEPSHVQAMPVVLPPDEDYERYSDALDKMARALAHLVLAEELYSSSIGKEACSGELPPHVVVRSSEIFSGRRRFDGFHYNTQVERILRQFASSGLPTEPLGSLCRGIWWPNRFSRVFGDNGTPYFSAEELFNLNAPVSKRVYAGLIDNADDYFLSAGWLLMARSGQIYGLNGSVMLATKRHEQYLVSEDLIRLKPDLKRVRPRYLLMALGHPTLGRPLVIRHAYGTSIPHLEPYDVSLVPVPRLSAEVEDGIAMAVEQAAAWRSEADDLEDSVAADAEEAIRRYLQGEAASAAPLDL